MIADPSNNPPASSASGSGPLASNSSTAFGLPRTDLAQADRAEIKKLLAPFFEGKVDLGDGTSKSIRPYSIGCFVVGDMNQRLAAQETQNPEIRFSGKSGLLSVLNNLDQLPEVVPGLNKILIDLVGSGANLSNGAGTYIPARIYEMYALANYLKVLAGPDFISNPGAGFFAALSEKIDPLVFRKELSSDEDKKLLENAGEVYLRAGAQFSRFLRLYVMHSLDVVFKLQEAQIDYKICERLQAAPFSADSLPLQYQHLKLDVEVWKRLREDGYHAIKQLADGWVVALESSSPRDRFAGFYDKRETTAVACPSPAALAKAVQDRATKILEETDEFVVSVLNQI